MIDFYYLCNKFLNLDYSWNINSLFDKFFYLINFRYFSYSIDNFLNDLFNLSDFLHDFLNRNNFLSYFLNLNDFILNIWSNFFNLFYSLLSYNFLNQFLYFIQFGNLYFYLNYFLNLFMNLLNFSMYVINNHNFFNYLINWNFNLYWNNYITIELNYFWLLDYICNYFLYFQHSRNFFCLNNNSIMENIFSSY